MLNRQHFPSCSLTPSLVATLRGLCFVFGDPAFVCRLCVTCRVQGSGFGVQGLGFIVHGLEFVVRGLGCGVLGLGLMVQGSWFGVQGLGFMIQGLG